VVVTVRGTGQVEPEQRVSLNFGTPGIVEAVLVEVGQMVEAGQVRARRESAAPRIAVQQAELGVQIAELSLERLQAPPRASAIQAAEAAVNSAWAAYVALRDSIDPEALRVAELQYEQALAAKTAAEDAYRDSNGAESANAQLGAASFAAEIARVQMEQLRAGPSQATLNAALAQVGQAQAQLELLQAGPSQIQLDQAAASVEQARLRLERAQAAEQDTILISHVTLREGGLAAPGVLDAVELGNLTPLHVSVEVDEVDIGSVAASQPVEITFDALPHMTLDGVVRRVADVAVQSAGVVSYNVRIDLAATDQPVRVGMTAAASIVVADVRDVLVVPNAYIRLDRQTNQAFVNVLDADGSLSERQVELGVQSETMSEIRSGLVEGDVVAADLNTGGLSFLEEYQ
jgi:multidrug efflux pump subunit AcrA (membrane-fusion protein)